MRKGCRNLRAWIAGGLSVALLVIVIGAGGPSRWFVLRPGSNVTVTTNVPGSDYTVASTGGGGGAQTNIAVSGVTNAGTSAYSNATSFVVSTNGSGTNVSIWSGGSQIQFTNVPSGGGLAMEMLIFPSNANADRFILNFAPTDGAHGMSLSFIGNHNVGPPEITFSSDGSIAHALNVGGNPWSQERREHFGTGASIAAYLEIFDTVITANNLVTTPSQGSGTNFDFSLPILYRAQAWSNGLVVMGNSYTGSGNAEPYSLMTVLDTNGNAAFEWGDYWDPNIANSSFVYPGNKWVARLLIGNNRGLDLRGKLVLERQTLSAGTTTTLDFNASSMVDITANAAAVTFATANEVGTATNYEPRVFVIRAGSQSPTLTWPNWAVVSGSLPASMVSGQMCQVRLGSCGIGETNKVAEVSSVITDPTFVWDGDALNWLTNANVNITDATTKGAVNTLVVQLKNGPSTGFNFWTNCDCIYPMVGPAGGTALQISNACRINLKTPASFPITWHGTGSEPVFDANGVTGDGSTAYGDVGYNLSAGGHVFVQNSAHLFLYEGVTVPTANGYFFCATPNNSLAIIQATGVGVGFALNSTAGTGTQVGVNTDYRGPTLVSRLSSGTVSGAQRSSWLDLSSTSSAMDYAGDAYLLARNNGSPTGYSSGNIRGASIGGGMTQTQWNDYRAIWDTFEAALSRKVP